MTAGQETVVLVHGLWVRGIAMELMRRRVARCGFRALAYSYPSMRLTLTENAERLARFCRGIAAPRLHFIGHSLGGLIIVRMLERAQDLPPGRAVLLGSPVGGSLAARRLARLPGGRAALGRSAPEWHAPALAAGGITREIGVIAGRMAVGMGRIIAPDLPAPSDGVVSVAETQLPRMHDYIVLDINHFGMLISRAVVRQICSFLRDGIFVHL